MARKDQEESGTEVRYNPQSALPDAVPYSDPRVQEYIATNVGLGLKPSDEDIISERRKFFEWDQSAEEQSNVPATLDTVGALNSEQLASLDSIEDLENFYDQFVDATELGHGFLQVEDKDFLVGKPFVIASYRFNASDLNESGEFVTVFVILRDAIDGHRKFFFNDGSDKSGIRQQMREIYNKTGRVLPIRCKSGLRKSEYEFDKPDGGKGRGTTFYIDES